MQQTRSKVWGEQKRVRLQGFAQPKARQVKDARGSTESRGCRLPALSPCVLFCLLAANSPWSRWLFHGEKGGSGRHQAFRETATRRLRRRRPSDEEEGAPSASRLRRRAVTEALPSPRSAKASSQRSQPHSRRFQISSQAARSRCLHRSFAVALLCILLRLHNPAFLLQEETLP